MITVKRLKELLKDLPDDAKCYAYEGERTGIAICKDLKEWGDKYWFIDASECEEEQTTTIGFDKHNKQKVENK